MYIKLNNGQPETYTIGQLRKDNPNTSFPKNIPPATLEAYGMYPVFDTPQPTTGELQTAVKDGYEKDAKGNWVVKWRVQDMFSDYTNDEGVVVTKAEQEAKYLTKKAEERVTAATNAIQAHLDEVAQSKRYDNIVSVCSYAGYPNPYQAEGQAAIEWRGAVWSYATNVWAEVALGTRTEPTIEELINELPTITWPA